MSFWFLRGRGYGKGKEMAKIKMEKLYHLILPG